MCFSFILCLDCRPLQADLCPSIMSSSVWKNTKEYKNTGRDGRGLFVVCVQPQQEVPLCFLAAYARLARSLSCYLLIGLAEPVGKCKHF